MSFSLDDDWVHLVEFRQGVFWHLLPFNLVESFQGFGFNIFGKLFAKVEPISDQVRVVIFLNLIFRLLLVGVGEETSHRLFHSHFVKLLRAEERWGHFHHEPLLVIGFLIEFPHNIQLLPPIAINLGAVGVAASDQEAGGEA